MVSMRRNLVVLLLLLICVATTACAEEVGASNDGIPTTESSDDSSSEQKEQGAGWIETEEGKQYLNDKGEPYVGGIFSIDGGDFYFTPDGYVDLTSGWKKVGEDWCFVSQDGSVVRNAWVGNGYYYVGDDSIMLSNAYADRFFLPEDGKWRGTFIEADWKVEGEWDSNIISSLRIINRCGYDYESPDTPPEQSIPSYKMAVEKGFSILLCDLRFTSDGVPVCYHYDKINVVARNTDGSEIGEEYSVENMTYYELLEYDWGIYKGNQYSGMKVMTFQEMLELMQELGTEMYVEIKTANAEQVAQAVELSRQYDISISWAGTTYDQCKAVIDADPTARVATMPRNLHDAEFSELLSLQTGQNEVFVFAYPTVILDNTTVQRLRENGISFEMGIINTEEEMLNYWTGNYRYCSGIESNRITIERIEQFLAKMEVAQ